MTKEELEREARINLKRRFGEFFPQLTISYVMGAEPREKRIAELETRCTELFLQNNGFAERFEKSIEIIKGLLSCCRNYPQENAEKMKQAEQFIKEIEE